MSEVNPADGTAPVETEQQEVDYSQETDEQLEARFAKGEGLIEDPPEPEPETVEVAEPPAEGEPEAEAQPEGGPEQAATGEPEYDEAASLVEEQRLEAMKRDTTVERQEFLLGREAGRAGHLQKQVDELRRALLTAQQPASQTDEYVAESPPRVQQPVTDSGLQASVAELQQDARNRGVEAEYASFLQDNPDASGLVDAMAPSVREQAKLISEMNLNGQALRKMLRMTLNGAYADAKLQEVRSAREEALTKRASQVPAKKIAKQVASVSGSGGAPAPRTRQKSVEDLTADEAEAALIREFGDGSSRRPRR